jgi:hypothetical protein
VRLLGRKEKLIEAIKILEHFCQEKDIIINTSKCEYIVFNGDYKVKDKIKINGATIDKVDHIRYLGVIIQKNLSNEKFIQDRQKKAENAELLTRRLGTRSGKMHPAA